MTMPNFAGAPQRAPNGFVQMGGGYEQSIQGQAPQQQVPQLPQTPLGQPTQVAQQPFQSVQQQGWFPPPNPMQQAPQQFQPQQQQPNPQFQSINQPAQQQFQPQAAQPVPLYQNMPPAPVPLSPSQPAFNQGNSGAWPDLNQRVSGPNVPQELQGKTVGEIIQLNQGLRTAHLGLLASQQPVPLQQQGAPVTPRTAPQPGQTSQPQPFDWRNPDASLQPMVQNTVRDVIRQELAPMLQPVVHQSMTAAAQNARNSVAQEIGLQRYAQLEPHIHEALNGIDPQTLTNAQSWRIAAQIAAGKMALAPQQQAPQAQQQQAPGGYPVQQMYAVQQPLPNLNTFWSEQPNMGSQMNGAPVALNQMEKYMASAMNMSEQDYAAWRGPRQGGV